MNEGTSVARLPPEARRLRILVVSELGGNWGHLLRVLPIIDHLQASGFAPMLTVANVDAIQELIGERQIEVVRTPGKLVGIDLGGAANVETYADILERCAFGDDDTLAQSVQQWDALLDRLAPDMVLSDFSPNALFIARLNRLPLVSVNTGWEVPPFNGTLPVLRPWMRVDPQKLAAHEADIVRRLNVFCGRRGVEPYANLGDLYHQGTRLMCTITEADHFGPRPQLDFVGPLLTSDRYAKAAWLEGPAASGRKRVLVYLARDTRNAAILQGLMQLHVDVIAVLPGIRKDAIPRFHGSNVRVWDNPIQLADVLSSADLVISNGGLGLITGALMAGVPLMIAPLTIEQNLIARRIEATGAATLLAEGPALRHCAAQLAGILSRPGLRAAALRVAARYRGLSQEGVLKKIVAAIEHEAGLVQLPA